MEETKLQVEQVWEEPKMRRTVKCDIYIFWIYFWFVVVIEIVVAYALQEVIWWCERWHFVLVIGYLSAIYGNGRFSVLCEECLGGSNLGVRWEGAVCAAKTSLSTRHFISLRSLSPSPLNLWNKALHPRDKIEDGATIVRRAWRQNRCRRMRMLWSLLHHIVMRLAHNQTGSRHTSRNLCVYRTSMCRKRLAWSRFTHHRRWLPGTRLTNASANINNKY